LCLPIYSETLLQEAKVSKSYDLQDLSGALPVSEARVVWCIVWSTYYETSFIAGGCYKRREEGQGGSSQGESCQLQELSEARVV
jgi:hypothetical protein